MSVCVCVGSIHVRYVRCAYRYNLLIGMTYFLFSKIPFLHLYKIWFGAIDFVATNFVETLEIEYGEKKSMLTLSACTSPSMKCEQ